MSMQAIKDVKLNVRPIYIDMSHLYVYEGPCRFGKGEELTYEFDRAIEQRRTTSAFCRTSATMHQSG